MWRQVGAVGKISDRVNKLVVIDEIDNDETHVFLVPHFVAAMRDNSGNTSDDFSVFVCQKRDGSLFSNAGFFSFESNTISSSISLGT